MRSTPIPPPSLIGNSFLTLMRDHVPRQSPRPRSTPAPSPFQGLSAESCKRHLHQLHVCLPSRPGHTRLLYRMSMDFAGWLRFVPGIAAFWRSIAGQVLGEDLVLVRGQQDRMLRGADTWQTPVSYDKLAVRYRRWRNRLEGGELDREVVAQAAAALAMSAGEMFALSEERCGDDNGTCVAE